ncbi:MAG: bifunctional N(6)-L-threonylcarbamoyladenine synthase/serine/threonine protein kinase [Candidatus Aenigmarchaeota archaeon]|nr:bifunctional N(6)-L-threonylcarbamoyladenine synthase/serine/threonine protein kinase [Candidatus Aenigmarchaeota archaeon]
MFVLGIESTAHTFGAGIVDDQGRILADARDMFKPPAGWGIKPQDAAAHHREAGGRLVQQAMEDARLRAADLDAIAFSQGAGLPPCLRVGLEAGRSLAAQAGKPLIPVCHQVAHLEIARLQTRLQDPVILYVSGGNTQVISHLAGRYRVFGETQDVGVGNALDKFGRAAALAFPAGPEIERLASRGSYSELPYVVKGMDLSFSGILTAALQKLRHGAPLADLCCSLQETFFAMLTEVTERALAHVGKEEVILTGGVAANQRLCQMLDTMCRERGARFLPCPLRYCGDNGAMIAWNGMQQLQAGNLPAPSLEIRPRLRTDDVDVAWL